MKRVIEGKEGKQNARNKSAKARVLELTLLQVQSSFNSPSLVPPLHELSADIKLLVLERTVGSVTCVSPQCVSTEPSNEPYRPLQTAVIRSAGYADHVYCNAPARY